MYNNYSTKHIVEKLQKFYSINIKQEYICTAIEETIF